MKIADLLKAFASDLEREDNEAILLSEDNEEAMEFVASALVQAATILREAASTVEENYEPDEASLITTESLEEIAAVAQAFDESGDPLLRRQASVLDEILMTIGAPKDLLTKHSENESKRIEELKKKYDGNQKISKEQVMATEAIEAINKSPYMKEYRPLEAPLQSRYCPDHPGAQIARIAEHQYQCSLDGKIFDFEAGFKTEKGNTVPGTSVERQTQDLYSDQHTIFDTRDSRLGNYYEK